MEFVKTIQLREILLYNFFSTNITLHKRGMLCYRFNRIAWFVLYFSCKWLVLVGPKDPLYCTIYLNGKSYTYFGIQLEFCLLWSALQRPCTLWIMNVIFWHWCIIY